MGEPEPDLGMLLAGHKSPEQILEEVSQVFETEYARLRAEQKQEE